MSPNVGNFVHDLVEMAKAMETLPQVQAELDAARGNIESQQTTVQRLELKLMERSNEITELQSRIRSLEVERDDAQFHALEADDRTSRALDFIKATFGNAGSLIQALEPARPAEPVTEPAPSAAPWPSSGSTEDHSPMARQGQSEPLPSSPVASPVSGPEHAEAKDDASASPAPEVAPMQDPIGVTTQPSNTSGDGASSASNAESTSTDQSFSMPPKSPGQFEGKTYSEVAKGGVYPTRQEWEANGGTIDNWYA